MGVLYLYLYVINVIDVLGVELRIDVVWMFIQVTEFLQTK
jgi:hypothetical protein